jgi:hypothetical protein
VRNTLIAVGLSSLAEGYAFMYASLDRRASPDDVARPVPGTASAPTPGVAVDRPVVSSGPPRAPDEARSAQLFDRNRGMPSDPDLATEYEQLNLDYFKNILPAATSVRWESGLADLGPMIAEDFNVLGLTDGTQILLNPLIERDRDQRRRALCHEMVHMAVWKQDTGHGPVFQSQLRHLAELGAFKGIVSTDEERDAALAEHARAVRRHVDALASRDYAARLENAPAFVVLFLPDEGFLAAAAAHDRSLTEHALGKGVVLATPATLYALLGAVARGWRDARLEQNTREVLGHARALDERLALFVEHLAKVGASLGRSVEAYNGAIGSLESRVLPQVRRMRELGAEGARPLAAAEPITVAVRAPGA